MENLMTNMMIQIKNCKIKNKITKSFNIFKLKRVFSLLNRYNRLFLQQIIIVQVVAVVVAVKEQRLIN